ncbi:MAG: glycosyltransferase family 2 protein [cyanobacterium endosymbiont of Rhopalodia fuxianensis]
MSIVIINYGTPNLVIDCLRSLEEQIDINEHCVILVDNASRDDSVLMLE